MRPFRNFWQRFTRRFADGSLGTKLSYFIFGAGNLYHKQIIKGLIFLILQIAIILFMVLCPTINGTAYGYKALLNLPMHNLSEGGAFDPATGTFTHGSNCRLIILFGFVTIAVIIIYFILWDKNIESSYRSEEAHV